MRDVALSLLVLYFVVRAFPHPWIGILGWTLLSIMNLHHYSWALASMPVAAMLAGATLLGLLTTRDRRSLPITAETVMLLALVAWFTITLPFSFYVEASYPQWAKVMKIELMIVVALIVIQTRRQIIALAAVLAFSIGFYGFKGGLFTLATGGGYRVWGPPGGSYIEGNNELALALITIIPILRFLQLVTDRRWLKLLLLATMLLSAAAALGTHSRGALLAIAAMAVVLWWRSDSKLISTVVIVVAGIGLVSFMPEQWTARMETIGSYQDDSSAMGRINAWMTAWNIASRNFFGGGFQIYYPQVFAVYAPNPESVNAAHSIYFQILGEHGFVGLLLYVGLWACVFRSAGKLRREGPLKPQTQWLAPLGSMIQVSLVGFAVGGAFLSLAYFDLTYNLLVLTVAGRRWLEQEGWTWQEVELPLASVRRARPALQEGTPC